MKINKDELSSGEIEKLSLIFSIIIFIIFILLFIAFWYVQILKNSYFNNKANKNVYTTKEINPPRGIIIDRNGEILAENKLSFSLYIIKSLSKDLQKSLNFVSKSCDIDIETLKKRIIKYKSFSKHRPFLLADNLNNRSIIKIKAAQDKYPEFEVEVHPGRNYNKNISCSHIIGYISEITDKELNNPKFSNYSFGDYIGRNGVEKIYQDYLKGMKGEMLIIRDNIGRALSQEIAKKPKIGNTVKLTIDYELQIFIEKLLEGKKGAAGVMDLKTGGLLAMASNPGYNPSLFTQEMSQKQWKSLINNPKKPLHNRFIQGCYSPGSTFKLIVALTALEENIVSPYKRIDCYGAVKIYDRFFHCWKTGGHGSVDMSDAIKNSCNVYFYLLGKKLNINNIAKYANMFGLGKKTNIDLANEKSGLMPTEEWKQKKYNQKWYPGETISISIGGGPINITPAQALNMTATIATRGYNPQIHIVKEIYDNKKIVYKSPSKFRRINIKRKNLEYIIDGLYRVVNEESTGRAAKLEGFDVCGKTGTQQIISKEHPRYKQLVKIEKFKPHSWFISFAPMNNPKFAVVVFIENGGEAGAVAAPIAGEIYKEIFK